MGIVDDTKKYESWLRTKCAVWDSGIAEKHGKMTGDVFPFFRATCYRAARKAKDWYPKLLEAPVVPSVGDAHVENFGTWRDAEGRLVWGVNDFDEAAELPYTVDLVRLATSTLLFKHLPGTPKRHVELILTGYRDGLKAPVPRVKGALAPGTAALFERIAQRPSPDDASTPIQRQQVPPHVVAAMIEQMPAGTGDITFATRQKGGGSLGRPRYLATGTWRGGPVAREAKALVPSAWDWAARTPGPVGQFLVLATGRCRSPDPFLSIRAGYVIRRIAGDSEKIDLDRGSEIINDVVLAAMGGELAAIHVSATVTAATIEADMAKKAERRADWLFDTAKLVAEKTKADWKDWYKHPDP